MDKIYLLQAETGFEYNLVIINAYRDKKDADDACIKLKTEMDLLMNKYSYEETEKLDEEYENLIGDKPLYLQEFIKWRYFTDFYCNIEVRETTLL